MLHFYLIKDATPASAHGMLPADFLGGIDYSEFEQLQDDNIIENHLDFFKDFRWTSEQVATKLAMLTEAKSKEYRLYDILRRAKEQDCGLIAYCD